MDLIIISLTLTIPFVIQPNSWLCQQTQFAFVSTLKVDILAFPARFFVTYGENGLYLYAYIYEGTNDHFFLLDIFPSFFFPLSDSKSDSHVTRLVF